MLSEKKNPQERRLSGGLQYNLPVWFQEKKTNTLFVKLEKQKPYIFDVINEDCQNRTLYEYRGAD